MSATDDSDLPTAGSTLLRPLKQLHYTGKVGLTKAYVEGNAVRAVCGQWWIPIGDESTHVDLPVCPECERKSPSQMELRASCNVGLIRGR